MSTPKATQEQWEQAQQELDDLGYRGRPLTGDDEVWCVLDSIANEEDAMDNLEEFRMWRTPLGRRMEEHEAMNRTGPDYWQNDAGEWCLG